MSGPNIEIDGNDTEKPHRPSHSKTAHTKTKRQLMLSEIALILEAGAVIAALLFSLIWAYLFLGLLFIVMVLFALYIFISPICGIILGIVSLFTAPRTKQNIVCSSLAIALPILTLLILILLFSANVIVIRFM